MYRCNVGVSAAFWESFAYFEVALLNALDERMSERHLRLRRTGHWIFDDARELGRDANGPGELRQPYRDIGEAVRRVRNNRQRLDAGQVISEVSFGFRRQMVSRKQMAFWPDIAAAFRAAPDRKQATVHDPVKRLREIRNRISHHHRVWAVDLQARYDDLLDVAGYIDPHLRTFIDERSRLARMLSLEP